MNNDLISREALKKSVNDELERLSCVLYKNNDYYLGMKRTIGTVLDFINNAPTVEAYTIEDIQEVRENALILGAKLAQRPQGKFVEMLKDQIEKSVCKHCPMNKNCVLCEISRVFQIITIAVEELKSAN